MSDENLVCSLPISYHYQADLRQFKCQGFRGICRSTLWDEKQSLKIPCILLISLSALTLVIPYRWEEVQCVTLLYTSMQVFIIPHGHSSIYYLYQVEARREDSP